MPRLALLHLHDGVAWAHLLDLIRCRDVAAKLDLRARREAAGSVRIDLSIEGDHSLRRACSPREHRQRSGVAAVADFENASLASRPVAPIGLAAVAADNEIALR